MTDNEETRPNNSSQHLESSKKTKDSKTTTEKVSNSTEKVKEKAKDSDDDHEESQYYDYEETGELKSETGATGDFKLSFICPSSNFINNR